ncbi:MAG: protein kinase [Acidobacteria bacterium]|nr:protein kinase [Acidobacteriota bacterium]
MIGQVLGHHRVLEKIGEGGMGVVYRAHDERLDRDVALKVLPSGVLADEAARKRFRQEALTVSKLTHSNIGMVLDFDTQEDTDFLVMEHISGVRLDHKLSGALPEKEIIALGMQLAAALAEAHEDGVIHRDLKPGNIIVTPKGQAKVLDFGLAKLLQPSSLVEATASVTHTGTVSGTLPYMAPEQLRGEPADARTDIHALGAVLYEMATGQRPFREELTPRLTDAILHRSPVSPRALNERVSPEVERIILKCLEKDPDNRYQSSNELGVDLRRLGAPATAAAVASVPTAKARRPLAVAVALAAAALVAVAVLWRERPPAAPLVAVTSKPSVAVLPLANMSADPANDYFSDGMTEEIISKLSRIQGLQVASRTSVTRYKGTQKDIKEIGRELGVRYLLEGSVRKAGERVRITVQLIDSSSGFHLWSNDFDRELKDVFAVQEETALKIAEALNLRLTPQEQQAVRRRHTDDAKAYDAYLRGRALTQYFDVAETLDLARGHYEQALQHDPDYAPAMAGLSIVESHYCRNLEPKEGRLKRADELAQRALGLDPSHSETQRALGLVLGIRYDYAGAENRFRESVRLEPDNALAWMLLAWARSYQQPPNAKGAEEAARESIRLQPSSFAAYYQLGRARFLQGRYEEAIEAFQYAKTLNPQFTAPQIGLAQVYLAQGKHDLAVAELKKNLSTVAAVQMAVVYAAKNDKERALAELTKALDSGYRDFAYLDASPYLTFLRSDARYQKLIARYRK